MNKINSYRNKNILVVIFISDCLYYKYIVFVQLILNFDYTNFSLKSSKS